MNGRGAGIAGWSIALIAALAFAVAETAGLRINLTHSAPPGLWLISPLDAAGIGRGTMVELCPPPAPAVAALREAGILTDGWPRRCPGSGVTPLLKPVAAVAGDRVTVAQGAPVSVNGETLPNSAARAGLPAWPDGEYAVEAGQVWVFSGYSPRSFDSRYFGPVAIAQVHGIARPLLTGDGR